MSRFLAAYSHFVSKSTDAPYDYVYASGLACLSTVALGRRWIERGSGIRPNLFMMLVGPSSQPRKTTMIKRAKKILEAVEPDRLTGDDFTSEGLVSSMLEKLGGQTKGIRNKILIPIEEFGQYLAMSRSYAASLSATLCRLYDGDDYIRMRSKQSITVPKPRVSLMAATAYGMLEKFGDPQDWITGFYARFLFVTPHERPPPYPVEPHFPSAEFAFAKAALTDLRDELKATDGPMIATNQAEQMLASFASSFPPSEDAVVDAVRERYIHATWKLAMLYQIDENPQHPIGPQAMGQAIWFIDRCWQGFQKVYDMTAGSDMSRLAKKIQERVRIAGSIGIPKRDLLANYHLSIEKLVPILDTLTKMGAIEIVAKPPPSGGRAKEYVIARR